MKRRIAAIAVALVVAVIGAIAVISYANSADARAVAGQQVTEVFIAAKRVPKGTTEQAAVTQKLIARQKVVAKGVPDGAMTAMTTSNEELVALSDIPAGTVVLNAGFGPKSQVKATTGVPKGKVALSVSLSDPAGVAPLIKPGSQIAIYDTFNSTKSSGLLTPYGAHLSDDKPTTRGTSVVLPKVEVLQVAGAPAPPTASADGSASSGSGAAASNGSSGVASASNLLVTVIVSPKDATRLVHAIQTGNLYVALLGDGAKVNPNSTSNDNNVVKH